MPVSKHRRKGKLRSRQSVIIPAFLNIELTPEDFEIDRLTRECLHELHGEEREWTNDEWDAARNQLVAEGKVRPDENS